MKQLTKQHIEANIRLKEATKQVATAGWNRLGYYDDAGYERFMAETAPALAASRTASSRLMVAYVSQSRGGSPVQVDYGEVNKLIRNNLPLADVYKRPFQTVWSEIAAGSFTNDATAAGLLRLTRLVATDVQLSMRATAQVIERERGFYGWVRVANPDACELCASLDGAYVKASEGYYFPIHDACNCGVEELEEPHEGAVNLPDGTQIRAYQYGPLNDSVAIERHDELGPVLTPA